MKYLIPITAAAWLCAGGTPGLYAQVKNEGLANAIIAARKANATLSKQ